MRFGQFVTLSVFCRVVALATLIFCSGCVDPADDVSAEVDAGAVENDDVNPDIRPLDACAPLVNQYLTTWIENGVPEGTCAKFVCPEGNNEWNLMACHKVGGGAEVYWEIDCGDGISSC